VTFYWRTRELLGQIARVTRSLFLAGDAFFSRNVAGTNPNLGQGSNKWAQNGLSLNIQSIVIGAGTWASATPGPFG